jgi:hypothetical protein
MHQPTLYRAPPRHFERSREMPRHGRPLAALIIGVALHAWAAPSADELQAFRDTRGAMCRAVVREMHIEIHKHKLRKNGEDDIYETVPAICLAIVQNYSLTATAPPSRKWSLKKRAVRLDDDDALDQNPSMMMHLITLKKACEHFTDDFQQELSELMYRSALLHDIEPIVSEFCESDVVVQPPKPPPSPRKRVVGSDGGANGGGSSGGSGSSGSGRRLSSDTSKTKDSSSSSSSSSGGGGGSSSSGSSGSSSSSSSSARRKSSASSTGDRSDTDGGGRMPDMAELLKRFDTDGSISTAENL